MFYLPKINKNTNTNVCSIIALNKKPLQIENSQPIYIANHSTGSYSVRPPSERNFRTNYSTHTNYKMQNIILSVDSIISVYIT